MVDIIDRTHWLDLVEELAGLPTPLPFRRTRLKRRLRHARLLGSRAIVRRGRLKLRRTKLY